MRMDARPKIHPADVRGHFRTRRNFVSSVLLVFFFVAPWVRLPGGDLLHVDLSRRMLTVFGVSFWAHEVPALLILALIFLFSIAWVTSLFGRVWCGWACPQTVYTEFVFRRIERWIEGDGLSRRRFDAAPWDADKVLKKAAKWALFFLFSLAVAITAVRFFVAGNPLSVDRGAPLTVVGLGFFFAFVFGYLREGFCIGICPYGRLQSLMIDESTTNVAYDAARPDCISCNRCIQVCPTGIDIRHGLQLECIGCTSCADACDAVMSKVKKPLGLIGYRSRAYVQESWPKRVTHARPALYLALLVAFSSGLLGLIASRPEVAVQAIRSRGAPYDVVEVSGAKSVVNRFHFDLRNQTSRPVVLELSSSDPEVRAVSASFPVALEPGELKRADLFVTFAPSLVPEGSAKRKLRIRSNDGIENETEISLVGPYGRAAF